MSQNRLAREVRQAATVINRYETKPGRLPRVDILFNVSVVLGVTMEWLMTGEGDPCREGAPPFPSSLAPGAAIEAA